MKINLLIVVVLLLINPLNSQCSSNNQLPGIETGIITVGPPTSNIPITSSSNQTEYLYPFKNTFQTLPQVVFALTSFQGTRIKGFAFQMVVSSSSGTGVRVKLITPQEITQWSFMRFTVMVNSRSDFEVGTYTPSNWELGNRQVTVAFSKRYTGSGGQIIARPYLSGIYIETNSSLTLQMMQLATNQTSFVVGIASNAPIRGIFISYFAFSPSVAGFVSYGGITSQPSINGTVFQTVQSSLSSSNNNLFGLTGFAFGNSARISLTSTIDSRFILSMNGNSQNTTVSFIVVGNNPNTVCSRCPGTVPNYDRCVERCGNGQVLFNYLGGNNRGCIDCPAYAFLRPNLNNTDCMCQDGYYLVRGACMPIQGANSLLQVNLTAETLQTQFYNSVSGGSNVVVQNVNSQTQNLVCPDPNSYLSNNNCYCLPGFYLIDGRCNKCPDGSYFNGTLCLAVSQQIQQNTQTQTINQPQILNPTIPNIPPTALPISIPQPNPNTNVIINPGPDQVSVYVPSQPEDIHILNVPSNVDPSVFFPPGFIPDNIIIIINQTSTFNPPRTCPVNQYLSSPRTCVCIPGYTRNQNGYCSPNSNNFPCTMRYAYINGDGYCVCPIGMAFNMNYECVRIDITVVCPVGGFLQSDGTCICLPPYVNSGGICIRCPREFFWNGLACVLSCPIDRVFNPSTVSCVCMDGYIEGVFSNCIRCPINSVPFNNICVSCPPYSIRQGNRCVCVRGAVLTNDICRPLCPPRSYYDSTLQRCICFDQNYYLSPLNVCISCPAGRFFDGTTCIQCSLPAWFDYRLRVCRVCDPPFFYFDGQCVTCPINSNWNSNIRRCQCILGYSVRNGICQVNPDCPNGRIVNGLCVMCRNGEIINNVCVCNLNYQQVAPGVCLPICVLPERRNRNGICVTCPLNSVWDTNTLDCVCNAAGGYIWNPNLGICVLNCPPAVSKFQNGQCICNEGYYPVPPPTYCLSCPPNCVRCTSTQCQACLPGFTSVGNVCIPNCGPGFYLLNNICNPCTIPCLTCSVFATNCTSCITGYTLIGNTCQVQCPQNSIWNVGLNMCVCLNGFFMSQNICVRCPTACVTCTSLTSCTQCVNNQPPINGFCHNCLGGATWVNNQCTCPPPLYYNGTGCSQCIQFCISCTGINNCNTCIAPRIYNQGMNQCQCAPGMTSNILNECVCPARQVYNPTTRRCDQCPANCLVCSSATQCIICVNPLVQPVNGQCPTQPPVCTPPQYACARGCCTCNVPLCTRCNNILETICDECTPPAVRNILGQCVTGGCNPACAPGEICYRERCYGGSQFSMNLISDIYSGVDRSNFRISILPAVTFFQEQYGALSTLNSRTFVQISFQGLTVRQIPSAYCEQQSLNLANWDCIIPYYNQPIPVPYNLIITATSKTNPSLSAYLLLTINPVQARSSISDATALMRVPGSLVTITTMNNVVDAGVVRP